MLNSKSAELYNLQATGLGLQLLHVEHFVEDAIASVLPDVGLRQPPAVSNFAILKNVREEVGVVGSENGCSGSFFAIELRALVDLSAVNGPCHLHRFTVLLDVVKHVVADALSNHRVESLALISKQLLSKPNCLGNIMLNAEVDEVMAVETGEAVFTAELRARDGQGCANDPNFLFTSKQFDLSLACLISFVEFIKALFVVLLFLFLFCLFQLSSRL